MFEKILLPLDGSELAEIVLPYGEELASRLGSEVILFHVTSPEHKQYHHMHKMYLDSMADVVRRQIRKSRPKSGKVNVRAETLLGEPVETICDYVEKNDIGLMIMAASGASGLKLWMVGSVASKAFEAVSIPTMLIRTRNARQAEGRKRAFNRILLPLDGSNASKLALPFVEYLAVKLKAKVTLFQMAQKPYSYATAGLGGAPPIDFAKLDAAAEKQARAYLIDVERELRQKGIPVTHNVVSSIDPADEIIEVGKKVDADLVVMSTRGQSPIQRWILGSTAEKVMRQGDIPLLLVRQPAA